MTSAATTSTLDCPATGMYHLWRPETRARRAFCRDCQAVRCAGRFANRRCAYPAVAYPGNVPSCPAHISNPGGIPIN